ncbi:hypothetical protein CGLO_01491 [Colletotrichum gloeosporioides Cg-14]|uniref:Uncharacterized protein n=1 Tax=Colletotrichum gloeosporioides (strain Cg-14) TaxID=1237896 RepID=T0KRT5_COLGC|nr:hypothetical protein CGLO_01491 [Colletotrichum gloeosporioides Cg-14]
MPILPPAMGNVRVSTAPSTEKIVVIFHLRVANEPFISRYYWLKNYNTWRSQHHARCIGTFAA